MLVADLVVPDRDAWQSSRIASIGVLAALDPVITLAADGDDRFLFGGAYVVDHYALALKGFFLVATYITILISVDYIGEGDYYKGEFYFLLLTSTFGMMIMASARDLITLFVALETISIPTFILAAFRKHDRNSNEAGVKYYLIGVLSSALMLYGMSFIFGDHGLHEAVGDLGVRRLARQRARCSRSRSSCRSSASRSRSSAVPFHFWAPDTYEGAPTPVTAFLSVASKAGGFVALITIIYFGFYGDRRQRRRRVVGRDLGARRALDDVRQPRRAPPDEHRPHAGVLVDRAGWVHARAVRGRGHRRAPTAAPSVAAKAMSAVVIYLLIYGAMNLGAFAVVIAVARRTGSAEISSYAGLFATSPGARGHDDDLHGVARRHPDPRGLVRQVRDVPLDHRRRHRMGYHARGDRGRSTR